MLVRQENISISNKGAYHAVSLFSNCGAGDIGYSKAGFTFDVMAELQLNRLNVCLLNHPSAVGIKGDLRETWVEVVETYKRKTKSAPLSLLAACPPCQGMSSARGSRGLREDPDAGSKDKRNLLAVIIANVAIELEPKVIVVENVPEFLSKKVRHPETNEPITASNLLIQLLSAKYRVFPIVLDMCDFGVPQSRKRTFLTFVKHKQPGLRRLLHEDTSPYPHSEGSPISLKDALSSFDLPSLDASNMASARCMDEGKELHQVPVLAPHVYEMVKAIPPNTGSSAWKNNRCSKCGKENTSIDATCMSCSSPLSKPIIKTDETGYRLIKGFATSYKRMHPDRPACTILTASSNVSSHNTIHPYENRVFSILECSKLQTFGTDFKWGDTLNILGPVPIRKMIGEAVPPKFTQLHGNAIMSVILNVNHSLLPIKDKRCIAASNALRKAMKTHPKYVTFNSDKLINASL